MSILSEEQESQFNLMKKLLNQCLELAEKLNYEDQANILNERLKRLNSAAQFVIVGEVKAGKSSFVNALLETEICEVAPDPCTSKIQEIVYGEKKNTIPLNGNCERVTNNENILKKISIIDTPGTNSIIKNHQTITEKYIPQSDLIIFVFPATNPHTGSAWDFLELVQKEWRRKAIFILQQSDRASSQELDTNKDRVKQYARKRNVQNPVVFSLSAKKEIEGKPNSGFVEFRNYIKKNISNGEIWSSKVQSIRDLCLSITQTIERSLKEEKKILKEDMEFYSTLILILKSRKEKIQSYQDIVVNSLCSVYDRLLKELENDFKEGLSVGNVLWRSVPFLRDKNIKDWINDLKDKFEKNAKEEIKAESLKVSKNISSELENLFNELNNDIEKRQNAINKTQHGFTADRDELLKNLEEQLNKLKRTKLFEKAGQAENIGHFTFASSGLAALGAIIAAVTHIAIFDLTGGILATVGAALIGVTLVWKRSSIIKEFSKNVDEAKSEFRERINNELENIFNKVFNDLEYFIKQPQKETEERIKTLNLLIKETESIYENSQKLVE